MGLELRKEKGGRSLGGESQQRGYILVRERNPKNRPMIIKAQLEGRTSNRKRRRDARGSGKQHQYRGINIRDWRSRGPGVNSKVGIKRGGRPGSGGASWRRRDSRFRKAKILPRLRDGASAGDTHAKARPGTAQTPQPKNTTLRQQGNFGNRP